ncbi:MAG: hypothetical protein R3B84_23285 [Zavarzinella sp.]
MPVQQRILIAYNSPVLPENHPDAASELDILEIVEGVEETLQAYHYPCSCVGYDRHPRPLLEAINWYQPDAIFNLYEGCGDRSETEIANAALLEWLNIPFTGSGSLTLALCRDKVRTKHLLQSAGLPTPPFMVVEGEQIDPWTHAWPAFVKLANQDGSLGIDQGSVVTNQQALEDRVRLLQARYAVPILVEQYIAGREIYVNMFESATTGQLQMIPPGELRYDYEQPSTNWPIYTYAAKWDPESPEFGASVITSGVSLPECSTAMFYDICRKAFRLVGLRDYGRLDFRITPEGVPYILEVNPNPYLYSPTIVDGLSMLELHHETFIIDLAVRALARRSS